MPKLFTLTVLFACLMSVEVSAESELSKFFPSDPIHQDDNLNGSYKAEIRGCNIKLTHETRDLISVTRFNVQDYETDPSRLALPYGDRFSTRYNVSWLSRSALADEAVDRLNEQLRELRVSLFEYKDMSEIDLLTKSESLRKWLSEIRSGSHGRFAKQNHTEVLLKKEKDIVVSVWIRNTMVLPSLAKDIGPLTQAIFLLSNSCSRE